MPVLREYNYRERIIMDKDIRDFVEENFTVGKDAEEILVRPEMRRFIVNGEEIELRKAMINGRKVWVGYGSRSNVICYAEG